MSGIYAVSAGITAHVFGPNVAGAIPEVPATGLIRVVVEDGEADLARVMVQQLQTSDDLDDEDGELFVDSLPLTQDD